MDSLLRFRRWQRECVSLDSRRTRRRRWASSSVGCRDSIIPGQSKNISVALSQSLTPSLCCSLPNAQHAIDFTTLRMEIYAVEPIPSNKEIAIEYLPGLLTLTRAERSDALRESFGFPRCLCTACTGSEELGVESDRRRVEIKRVVGELKGEADRATKMGLLEEMRVLLAEEKYIGPPEFGSCFSD